MLLLIRTMLQENWVSIRNEVARMEPLIYSTGVIQNDKLSPLLFSLLLSDLPFRVQDSAGKVKTMLYADHLVIVDSSRLHFHETLVKLAIHVEETELSINIDETESMKFRLAASYTLHKGKTSLKQVNGVQIRGDSLALKRLNIRGAHRG